MAVALLALCFVGVLIAYPRPEAPDLIVHEWGTFTAVAGSDGRAIDWIPLVAPDDLPSFVEHLDGAFGKAGLRGTIRMETPVLYFYSPSETNVSVKVRFSSGVITEWYPHAAQVRPNGPVRNADLSQLPADGTIAWDGVTVSPNLGGAFPHESAPSRYYAARATASAPLLVHTRTGDQQEKFLFYRGVSAAALPLSATQTTDNRLLVRSLAQEQIPAIIFFERRGERIGYRVAQAPADEAVLDPPELTSNLDSLRADLERILVEQGLFPDEAHAMVETWHDSWFEEGSRLIYIVPRAYVDQVLPLKINPTPGRIVRVFVGRMEIITPTTIHAVQAAIAAHDEAALLKYGRFVEPILRIARQEHTEPAGLAPSGR